jgi:DNA-binding ferritin-like protein (Dps family)
VGTASKEVPESTTAWQSKSRAKHLIRKFQMDMKSIQTYSNHVKSQLPGNASRF